jgi:hypothetical protein
MKNSEIKNIELGNLERKTSEMDFFCGINSNDKKILYLINDKKKDNRKRHDKFKNIHSVFFLFVN